MRAARTSKSSRRDGTCIRSRRIHSTLRSEFDLRAFPFDKQTLTLRTSRVISCR